VLNYIPELISAQFTFCSLEAEEVATHGAPEAWKEARERVDETFQVFFHTFLSQTKVAGEKKESQHEGNETPPEEPLGDSKQILHVPSVEEYFGEASVGWIYLEIIIFNSLL